MHKYMHKYSTRGKGRRRGVGEGEREKWEKGRWPKEEEEEKKDKEGGDRSTAELEDAPHLLVDALRLKDGHSEAGNGEPKD
jgi:hypothetical protein